MGKGLRPWLAPRGWDCLGHLTKGKIFPTKEFFQPPIKALVSLYFGKGTEIWPIGCVWLFGPLELEVNFLAINFWNQLPFWKGPELASEFQPKRGFFLTIGED